LANHIDIVCDAYEQSWRSGANPKITAFLTGFEGASRDSLVAELLLLDCELHTQNSKIKTPEYYLSEFPEFASVIARVDFPAVSTKPVKAKPNSSPNDNRFAHFELLERLGEGASGTVWKAHDTSLRRLVALKLPHFQSLSEAERARFRREGRACAQLHHPNIVALYQVGEEEGRCYISSELIEGWNLRDWLVMRGRLNHVEAVRLVTQLADALQHAHEQGVIHRDIKPANVLLDHQGMPHVTDFGLARWADQSLTLTKEGHVLGTPAYMSPEQARGEVISVDRRTDIYGLGAIFYELLTGRPPFEGEMASVMQRVKDLDPPAPKKIDTKIPRDLETICLKAIQKSPSDRYSSMQAFRDDLQRYLGGEPIAARRTGFVGRSIRVVKRHKLLTGLLAACLLATGALAAVILLAEKNYRLQGYQTVSITTDPPGARIAFVPLSKETFEPELYRKVLAPKASPTEIELLPGDYLVVAVMADGRFHEVFRRVPKDGEHASSSDSIDLSSWPQDDGSILLRRVLIPDTNVTAGMTRISGTENFLFGRAGQDSNLPPMLSIRPFYVDRYECTLREYLADKRGFAGMLQKPLSHSVAASVSFYDAMNSAATRGKRLPTEAEYEFLATNGGRTRYSWGNEVPRDGEAITSSEQNDPFGLVGVPNFDTSSSYPEVICQSRSRSYKVRACRSTIKSTEGGAPSRLLAIPELLQRTVIHAIEAKRITSFCIPAWVFVACEVLGRL
jgi:serine/threonine-protein kinase